MVDYRKILCNADKQYKIIKMNSMIAIKNQGK